jgi:dienelactone hydrolase
MRPDNTKRNRRVTSLLPGLALAALAGCGGDSTSQPPPPPPVSIALTTDQTTLQPGGSAQLTATVSNDPTNAGVTWSVSCSSANCGVVDGGTATANTYVAPGGAQTPPADLTVTITATSVSNPGVKATAQIVVKGGVAITELDSDNPTVVAGASIRMRVILINDSANRGVTWSVSCTPAPCGTVAPAASQSGAWITYSAPAGIPKTDLSVTVTATAVSTPSAQASESVTVSALAVTVASPANSQLGAGGTAQLSATVNYPAQATQGVTWKVTCGASDCGKISPAMSANGAPVTYTAPVSAPPTDLAVTVTASAVAGSTDLTVLAIRVGVTPISALMPLSSTVQFTGSATYDPSGRDVDWSLEQNSVPCVSSCGAVAPAMTASGATTTYTAPATLPANSTVSVTATSTTDHTKTATATVTLTAGSVELVPENLSFAKHGPDQKVTLTNTGKTPLTITAMTFSVNNYSQQNTCGTTVVPGGSCTITVHCVLCRAATLKISDSSSDSPQTIGLQGGHNAQVAAAARTALSQRTSVTSPLPTGGNLVGTREVRLVDSSRADPFRSDGSKRELLVRFWYPASLASGCIAAPYTSPQVWSYLSTLVGVALPQVTTHSCLNAPVTAGAHPVVTLTHGFTGTFTDYTFLAEDLASRGYVVASVDHTHEATAVEFPDGRLETSVFGSHLTKYTRSDAGSLGFAVAVRLDDLQFVLNELARLNAASGGDFAGTLDLSRVGLVGHSLGGLTTLRALVREPRFKAGVLLDGLTEPHYATPIPQPVLSLVAGHGSWDEDDCRLWEALHGPRLAVDLPGAEHVAVSDAVWLMKGLVKTGDPNPDRAIAAIRDYVASFLDANLATQLPRSSPVAALPDYQGARVATQTQVLCSAQ